MLKYVYTAAYLAIAIQGARRLLHKTYCSRPRGVHPGTRQEPRHTIFAIPDYGHRCLVADVYTELTENETDAIEKRLHDVFAGMSVSARYCPAFARGCPSHVDLFTLGGNRTMYDALVDARSVADYANMERLARAIEAYSSTR